MGYLPVDANCSCIMLLHANMLRACHQTLKHLLCQLLKIPLIIVGYKSVNSISKIKGIKYDLEISTVKRQDARFSGC